MKTNTISTLLTRSLMGGTTLAAMFIANTALANPLGGTVVAGSAVIVPTTPQQTDINQSSAKAVINWNSFNIAPGETTNFNQPNAGAVTLNRIGDANPSQILGNLNATGQVMLVNPNGVFFGNQAKVNVNGLVATSADINNADFMTSKYIFSKAGNPNAQVVNNGKITASNGGYVALVAPTANNNGTITANLGKVAVAGTDVFTIDMNGDKLINFSLPVARSGPEGNTASASNHGKIYADQGKVQLTAYSLKEAVDSVVNMDGIIQARSGKFANKSLVHLSANTVNVGGNVDVTGMGNAPGGAVEAIADNHLAFTGAIKAQGGPSGGNAGTVLLQGKTVSLGGNISVAAPHGIAGVTTIRTDDPLVIGSAEIYTIADAQANGGTVTLETY